MWKIFFKNLAIFGGLGIAAFFGTIYYIEEYAGPGFLAGLGIIIGLIVFLLGLFVLFLILTFRALLRKHGEQSEQAPAPHSTLPLELVYWIIGAVAAGLVAQALFWVFEPFDEGSVSTWSGHLLEIGFGLAALMAFGLFSSFFWRKVRPPKIRSYIFAILCALFGFYVYLTNVI